MEIKKIIQNLNSDKIFKSSLIIFCFIWKKIHKKYFSEKPLTDIAVVTAEAPGSGIISISCFIHSLINITPGSETAGVPASDINEICLPSFNRPIILERFFFH